jgi:hypothetical protein
MRHNRAVKKLITRIGGFRPWSDKDFDKDTAQKPDELVESDDKSEENKWSEESESHHE